MLKIASYIALVTWVTSAAAQPATEIFLYDLKIKRDRVYIEGGTNVTNHPGYDNQPFFHPTEPLLYYVSADPDDRTDIYEYNFETGKTTHVTSTPEREYSPTVMPGGKYLSCIIQRDDGAQDLGRYPIRGGEAEVLIDSVIVGYHAWADPNTVVLFVLPQPFSLCVYDFGSSEMEVLTQNIGRSLHAIPSERAISFLQDEGGRWVVRRFNPSGNSLTTIASTPDGKDHDMCWTPRGGIIMSSGSKLFYLRPGGTEWLEVKGLDPPVTNKITRVAVDPSGKRIALVVDE